MGISYWHVDAFANRLFGGNQAAVMVLETWLSDVVLQSIAFEHNFPETAFLVPKTGADAGWELRWFSPACEVKLCGHATLASGHVLLSLEAESDTVRFQTRHAGILEVRRSGSGYELALPAIPTAPAEFPVAVDALQARPREIWRSPSGYTVFCYDSEQQVRGLRPDMRALQALGSEQFIVTAPGLDTDVVSRVFVPSSGVDEDSVTGSAHAAPTPLWTTKLGRSHFSAFQASSRGGHVSCRLEGDIVWLSGGCVTVVEGGFLL